VSKDASEQAAWRIRQRRRKIVARTYERIRWRRSNFTHQESRRLVNHSDLLAVEDLLARDMMANHRGQEHSGRGVAAVSRIDRLQGGMGRQTVQCGEPRVHVSGLLKVRESEERSDVKRSDVKGAGL